MFGRASCFQKFWSWFSLLILRTPREFTSYEINIEYYKIEHWQNSLFVTAASWMFVSYLGLYPNIYHSNLLIWCCKQPWKVTNATNQWKPVHNWSYQCSYLFCFTDIVIKWWTKEFEIFEVVIGRTCNNN